MGFDFGFGCFGLLIFCWVVRPGGALCLTRRPGFRLGSVWDCCCLVGFVLFDGLVGLVGFLACWPPCVVGGHRFLRGFGGFW